MQFEYSIVQAKNKLSEIVHQAETGKPIKLTRRGKPVAVLVSEREYARISGTRISFWNALTWFREQAQIEKLGIGKRVFDGIRSRDPGREVGF